MRWTNRAIAHTPMPPILVRLKTARKWIVDVRQGDFIFRRWPSPEGKAGIPNCIGIEKINNGGPPPKWGTLRLPHAPALASLRLSSGHPPNGGLPLAQAIANRCCRQPE